MLTRLENKERWPILAQQPIGAHLTHLSRTHTILEAVLAGKARAAVFVDDPTTARRAFVAWAEGCFVLGETQNAAAFLSDVHALALEIAADGWGELALVVEPAAWLPLLADPLRDGPLPAPRARLDRLHYTCERVRHDWRAALPAGAAVHRIDAELLSTWTIPDHITRWISGNWGDQDTFLAAGFGFVTVLDGQIVSWSLADCASPAACEIGIHTHPAYRQRGLAAITTAAAVEHALASGYARVGWHCNAENTGSIRTAERVGFVHDDRYDQFVIDLSPFTNQLSPARTEDAAVNAHEETQP